MSQNDVETTPDAGQKAAPSGKPVAKRPKATKETAPAEATGQKKLAAIDNIMVAIKDLNVLELSQLVKALEAA